jgi:fimbrial chaperone protein
MVRWHPDSGKWKARLSTLAFLLFLVPLFAHAAASLGVSPLRVELAKARPTAVLTLRNDRDAPTVVQAQVMAWSQQDGADQFAETRDILVSPPLFTIAAGSAQIIRVGLRRAPDPAQEITYRIFLQEVPEAARADQQTVRMALRLSLPVFVEAIKPGRPELAWSAQREPEGGVRVTVENSGASHVMLFDLQVGAPEIEAGRFDVRGPQYVLAGQKRSWLIKADVGASQDAQRLRVRAKSDAGDVDTEIALALP